LVLTFLLSSSERRPWFSDFSATLKTLFPAFITTELRPTSGLGLIALASSICPMITEDGVLVSKLSQ